MKKIINSIIVSLFLVPVAFGGECSEEQQLERNSLATQIFERQHYADGYLMALSGFSEPVAFEDAANFHRDKVAGRLKDLEFKLKMMDASLDCKKELMFDKDENMARICITEHSDSYKKLNELKAKQIKLNSYNEGFQDAISIMKSKIGSKKMKLEKMIEHSREMGMKNEINIANQIKLTIASACDGSREDGSRSAKQTGTSAKSEKSEGRSVEGN